MISIVFFSLMVRSTGHLMISNVQFSLIGLNHLGLPGTCQAIPCVVDEIPPQVAGLSQHFCPHQLGNDEQSLLRLASSRTNTGQMNSNVPLSLKGRSTGPPIISNVQFSLKGRRVCA